MNPGAKEPDYSEQVPLNNNNLDENNDIGGKENLAIREEYPQQDNERVVDIKQDFIWDGFPLSERFWYSFFCKTGCCSDDKHGECFSSYVSREKCILDRKLIRENLDKKIFSISILKSGTLEIIPRLLHPFVRISIVNLKTGKYLQKSKYENPCITRQEHLLEIKNNQISGKTELTKSYLDFIPPVSTCPYDLRERGESFAEWNEDFYFNERASYILQNENVILFELLDYHLNYKENEKEDCIIPMAWGYLKPVGFSQTYLGKHKIQLYKHKYSITKEMSLKKKSEKEWIRTPDLLFELDWIKKEKYQTYLQINISIEDPPTVDQLNNAYFYNKFIYSVFIDESENIDLHIKREKKKDIKKEINLADAQKKERLNRWRRGNKCMVPNQLLYKFNTARLGCLTHEFSHDGKYLAAACTEINSETMIKIFNVEDGLLRYTFKGHHNLIHHFTWSRDDLILISASSDNVVTLWRVPKFESNDANNNNPLDNDLKFKIKDLHHPAYVYSTDIYPDKGELHDSIILATACFDGVVRFFQIFLSYDSSNYIYSFQKYNIIKEIQITQENEDKEYFKNITEEIKEKAVQKKEKEKIILLQKTALDHRHPNVVLFDNSGRIYIGDSLGYIHIWELKIASGYIQPEINKIKILTHKELELDTINKITIVPNQTKRLLVHSRDNCIRLIDISTEKTKVILRYFGLKCNKTNIKSTASPDGAYVFSGSEEGAPHIWQLDSGIPYPTNRYECGFVDSVNDVSWNLEYNMNALSGFGQEYPLLVYVYERAEGENENILELNDKNDTGYYNNINDTRVDNNNLGISGKGPLVRDKGVYKDKTMIDETRDLKNQSTMIDKKFNSGNNNYYNNGSNPLLDEGEHNDLPRASQMYK